MLTKKGGIARHFAPHTMTLWGKYGHSDTVLVSVNPFTLIYMGKIKKKIKGEINGNVKRISILLFKNHSDIEKFVRQNIAKT